LSGLEPSPVLPDYREFVRVLLDIPVLEGPLFGAFQESLEIFAGLLSDKANPKDAAGERLRWLLLSIFSKGLPHSYWLDWALGRPSSESTPAWTKRMEEWAWVKDEIGISRIPTTVITVIPQRPRSAHLDWTDEMVRIYSFQRKCFLFGQTLPETVGGKLDDYGAVFVASADPRLPRLAQRRKIETIAKKIHDFAREELGVPVLVGVGETVAPGDPLADSYRQAVMSLHLRRDTEKSVIYFAGKKKGKSPGGFGELRDLLDQLDRSFGAASFPGMEALQEEFVRQAIQLSFNNPQEIRWHFQYALDRFAETAGNRMDLGKKEAGRLRMEISEKMEQAATLQELVLEFKEALRLLAQRIEKPKLFVENYSMKKIAEHLDENYQKSLHVAALARRAGVSASTLSRRFQKALGMGLEVYLQNRRLEEAKRQLKATGIPVFRIARNCGFKSIPHFVQLFKARNGLPPEKFRQKLRRG
jgi:AraC-like DNA-binding protein